MPPPKSITLRVWAGYREGPQAKPSTGKVKIVLHHGVRVTERVHTAIAAAKTRAKSMQVILLDAIVVAYPTFRQWHERPATITGAELAQRIELYELVVPDDHHDGIAYVAYMFSCDWDPSGFVVVTHGERVVAAGGYEVLELPIRDPARATPKPSWPTPAERRAARARAKKKATRNPAVLRRGVDELRITLPPWAGFVPGPNAKPSTGEVCVTVASGTAPRPAQAVAYRRVIGKAATTQRIVLGAIAAAFPKLARTAAPGVALPKKLDRAALEDHVALHTVHIDDVEHEGVAYVGYELHCSWDGEHGLGVLTHLDRIVDVGQADTAFIGWNADNDRTKQLKARRSHGGARGASRRG